MAVTGARALHYVFKIGNRKESINFYTQKLGMKILRHEEFDEGCKATCNGPYNGKWSKTMIGYGDEKDHFVLELTYNYTISGYKKGNDFGGIYIQSDDIFNNLKDKIEGNKNMIHLTDPDGHDFYIFPGSRKDPISHVAINVKNMEDSIRFWRDLIGMKEIKKDNTGDVFLAFGEEQCYLELVPLPKDVVLNRASAYGRIAFACPSKILKNVEKKVKEVNQKFIHTPYVSLDTPGKATVHVIILQDPNEHEICFVGEEAFNELSKFDPHSHEALFKAIESDDSNSFYKQFGLKKEEI
ncbi:Glyoxalase-like domain-containing protein [Strongyloides ratti]|uniref:Glyoxalase-like domain-containing protein n=1 Tax=Strongyloides ratti TaxID=34506 RepID=A0A090LCP9_STRRB|nr:Glyoxalase-like domain-containing protein [Strongyloides ratti]CEF65898.1 Glyoxalase-like domain-containing protein [Strongyloides ratti]